MFSIFSRARPIIFIALCIATSANANTDASYLIRCNQKLIEIVMEDLFNPPVASRVYMYPNIAAYQVIAHNNQSLPTLAGTIPHLPVLKLEATNYITQIAATYAFTTVAKKLIFSENMIADFEKSELEIWQKTINDTTLVAKSIAIGRDAGKQIISWMIADNYIQIKTMERYVHQSKKGAWRPTAPEYTNGLEPNWLKMRSIFFDNNTLIPCAEMPPYSEQKKSASYKNMQALYTTSKSLDTTQKEIAQFWDCNPNISYSKGHITYFVHKVSPGGHWLQIAAQACKNLSLSEQKTTQIFTMVAIGIYDGFINCWADKYMYQSIRPETFIQSSLDAKWRPYLQTPPFPEYPSGHSVISGASATILTHYIQQPYSFTDSSEMYLGIAPRTFTSFAQAATEAGISRYYGGIHFMPAITNGATQGKKIGEYILQQVNKK